MKRVTLADIAKECNVSVNTVSHALNNKSDISEATKQKIKSAAEKLGYIANASASFLRSGLSKTIAVIVGDISNPHFAILIKSGVPFTLMGRRFADINTNYVVLDDQNSGYIAAEHILKSGMKKTVIISAGLDISSAEERLVGIDNCYKEIGNHADFTLYMLSNLEGEHSKVMQKIVNCGYDSAICFNDVLALELLSYLDNDIKIVSFDNIRSRFPMPYKFASVTSSKTKMSHQALKILLDAIGGKKELVETILPTRIADATN